MGDPFKLLLNIKQRGAQRKRYDEDALLHHRLPVKPAATLSMAGLQLHLSLCVGKGGGGGVDQKVSLVYYWTHTDQILVSMIIVQHTTLPKFITHELNFEAALQHEGLG